MGSAGEGEVVDVGGAVVGPFVDVVDFAEVSGDFAVGVGASAVCGVQHDPLIGARNPFGASQVQWSAIVVENRQVVVGVGCHADQIAQGKSGTGAGDRDTGSGFELGQRGGDYHGHRQSVMGAQFP